jgi:hypothetical protein
MISIVDPETLQNVLRPTVYVPLGEANDQRPDSRRIVDDELNRPFTTEQRVHSISTLINTEPATAGRR